MGKDFDSGADSHLDNPDGISTERIYTVNEIIQAAREGRISGPIGMNTFVVFASDGKTVDWGGYIDWSVADELAFAIMDMKRRWYDKVEKQ